MIGDVQVTCKYVVHASNSPIHHNLAVHSRQTAYKSYVVGLKIPKGSVKKGGATVVRICTH